MSALEGFIFTLTLDCDRATSWSACWSFLKYSLMRRRRCWLLIAICYFISSANHSCLSAMTGSTRIARRAGI